MMNEELQRYLDGELELSELSSEARERARAWDAFLQEARSRGPGKAPPWLEDRVMSQVWEEAREQEPAGAAPWTRVVEWLVRPRPVPVPPAAALAAAALLAFLLWPGTAPDILDPAPDRETAVMPATAVYVEFSLEAPDASEVAVAGDFTGWEPVIRLEDREGDGVWSGRAMLPPGVHEYMFVIDGERWVTDPRAERYVDDGFGNRNAVLAISPPPVQPGT